MFVTIKRAFIYFSLTASVLCSFHRPADAQEAWKAEWDKTVAAARQEGKFVLYIRAYDGVVKAFSKRYPDIKLKLSPEDGRLEVEIEVDQNRNGVQWTWTLLRGRSEPLRAYEPLPATTFESAITKQYSEAFARLEANDVTAMPAFAALVGQHADDVLAGFHLRRLLNGGKGVRMQLE